MIHGDAEVRFVNPLIGYGVFATKLIPKGTITWVGDPLDQVITQEQALRWPAITRELLNKYSYLNGRNQRILCWDHARIVNHSCNATCLAPGFDFEIAVRDILPGEEITDDYGTLNLEEEFECQCDARECRGMIRPDDMLSLAPYWDAAVAAAFPLLRRVDQPLWELVTDKETVLAASKGEIPVPSCRVHYSGLSPVAGG
ncbi:MAG: SET domain-containing protein-lysine N-methyltransferase [Bryobacterales bacterium]|nr:SET domain-containing protein-lysine N-methyltransferase [Bryobacterales bacterium]MBV9400883.1 SET domain-containing protein-lysine N-methyltransferase [Bryobacterales bacterium]